MPWPSTTISTVNMDATTDSPAAARPEIKQMADNINTIQSARGASDGIASTDSGGKVPVAQLPTIPANQGGTGHTVFNVGDLFFANTTTTLQKLSAGALGYVLTSNGPGTAPTWQQAGGGLVAGTRLSFQQTTAPIGWTKQTSAGLNDSIMRIVTGTASSGGSIDFSTFSSQASVGATTLSIAQIPSHTHGNVVANSGTSFALGSGKGANYQLGSTGAQGGGGSHTHTLSNAIKYHDFIIAQKD